MRKLTALFLSLAMALGLAACSSGTPSPSESNTPETSAPQTSSEEPESSVEAESSGASTSQSDGSEEAESTDGNTLVVYFSATGNTEQAATYIADLTGGDLFELEPADPYTDEDLNYSNEDSRVSQEYEDEALRNVELVADTVENWDSYDTVFIGYPNWWADLPMAVYSFFDEYDFSGKTIIPFNVHNGSRFSRTIQTIGELEPDATVIENGFTVSEQTVADAAPDVAAWLEELGYLGLSDMATEGQVQTGVVAEQILEGETGTIHYSYYLPDDYDMETEYPLMVVMPGYDMMWFGEDSSGSNLKWTGFLCWTELPEDMIVVSAQLTDWHETSANQAIELTEYFMEHFSVDASRVYAAGYSAGGETMSQAVSMRPDLYAAYLHGASQWDGEYAPIAANSVAVYIFMAENDEYYGSQRAWDAYNNLHDAYLENGWDEDNIASVLQIQIPDNGWFAERGITGNYHGGGNVVFEEETILSWVISHSK